MHALIALCFWTSSPQDPDRSRPEKAGEKFLEFWLREDPFSYAQAQAEVELLGKFCCTEEFNRRLEKRTEEDRKWAEEARVLSSRIQVIRTVEPSDGTATVDALRKLRRKKRDWNTDRFEEVAETLLYRLTMTKEGELWRVQELRRECSICRGGGVCRDCQGTGQVYGQACYSCGGDKNCRECRGEKLQADNLKDFRMRFVIPEKELIHSSDLSTPRSAAQCYVDFLRRKDVEMSRRIQKFVEGVVAQLELFLVADLAKSVREGWAQDCEDGKRRYAEIERKIESIEEVGEEAFIVVVTTGGDQDARQRLVLKKNGESWLVDAVQLSCWSCAATGSCRACQGTGRSGEYDCFGCEGKKVCTFCMGKGWRD